MFVRNIGKCPDYAKGKRVRVRLRNGRCPLEHWAADGRNSCRWSLGAHPFDIIEFEVVG